MAITFINQMQCGICNEKIYDSENIFSFPPFIQNIKDPLYQFTDSVFHLDCLRKNIFAKRAMKLAEQYYYNINPENRKCIVDGKVIENYEDYLFIDVLTSDETEEIYRFNLTTLNKNNLSNWKDRNDFLYTAKKFIYEDKWKDLTSYKYLDKLISTIEHEA